MVNVLLNSKYALFYYNREEYPGVIASSAESQVVDQGAEVIEEEVAVVRARSSSSPSQQDVRLS